MEKVRQTAWDRQSYDSLTSVTITNDKLSDKMNVSCVAVKGREEVASTSGKIVVKDGPVRVLKGLEDMTVNEGTEALLKV